MISAPRFSIQRSDLVNFVIIFKIEMRIREKNLISKKRSEIFLKNSHLNFSKWDFFSKFSSHFSEVRFFEKILISLRRSENSKWDFFFSLRKWDFEMRISFRNLTLLEVRLEFSKKYYFAHLCLQKLRKYDCYSIKIQDTHMNHMGIDFRRFLKHPIS